MLRKPGGDGSLLHGTVHAEKRLSSQHALAGGDVDLRDQPGGRSQRGILGFIAHPPAERQYTLHRPQTYPRSLHGNGGFLPGLRQKKHYGDNQRRDGDAGIGSLEFSHGFHLVSFCTG